VCALTGELVTSPDSGYWVRQAREPVRFADAVTALAAQDIAVFLEIGPDGTLSALGPAALPEDSGAVFVPVLRPGQPGPAAALAALAQAYLRGVPVNWAAAAGGGRRVDLPTYAFQRRRYWPQPSAAPAGDAAALGLGAVGHPLLGAAVELAGGEGYLFTGRLSVRSQPWLAGYAVAGGVLLPGTAFVEMVILAGDAAGCGRIEELTLQAPLVFPADGAVRLQVVVGGADTGGGGHRGGGHRRAAGRAGVLAGRRRGPGTAMDAARQRAARPGSIARPGRGVPGLAAAGSGACRWVRARMPGGLAARHRHLRRGRPARGRRSGIVRTAPGPARRRPERGRGRAR
jgi:hypothetical protein